MIKLLSLLLLILMLFISDISCADTNQETPLTLINQPQNRSASPQQTPTPFDISQLHDIRGPVHIQTSSSYLLLVGGILFVLLLLALIYWFIKMRKKNGPPPVSPWEKALTELTEARKLFGAEQSLLYMGRLSQILRHYIESRFIIRSTRQTTEEFLQNLPNIQHNSLLLNSRNELQTCLEQCDLAKFAHLVPDSQIMTQMEKAVTSFIWKTTPVSDQQGEKS